MKHKVYLAGPMNGLSVEAATAWREYAAAALDGPDVQTFSPLRDKPFLRGQIRSATGEYGSHPLATSRGIITRDHYDCTTADVVLANFLGTDCVSIGTLVEMGWAWDRRIPVVMVAPSDNPHFTHPFGAELVSFRVDTLDDGIAIVKSILGRVSA